MNTPSTPPASGSTRIPSNRLAPLGGGGGGAPVAARAALVLLVASVAYLGFVLLRPLPAPAPAALHAPPAVEESRYAPINDASLTALTQRIEQGNIFTPDRTDWSIFNRPEDEAFAESDTPDEPTEPVVGRIQVDNPETLAPDVQAALAALTLTGIYAPTDGQIRAEFIARHRAGEPSFSVIPGDTFEVPRTPSGQLDTWTLIAIDRSTNRAVIEGLGANVPLSLFGTDVDLTPIIVDESGNATAVSGGPREPLPATTAVADPETPEAEGQPLRVERMSASDIEKRLRELQAEGYDVDITEIFRLMNVPADGEGDDETEEGGAEDEPEAPEPPATSG